MSRPKAAEEIRLRGGSIAGKVSKNTNFLVVGEEAGSKLQEAERLGVSIINEKNFLEMLGTKLQVKQPTLL